MNDGFHPILKALTDTATIVIGTSAKILPSLVALVTFMWYSIRIYEWRKSN
jgi:hypothetical protein